MNYATPQDLIDRFGERELVQLTDPDLLAVNTAAVQRALDDAQAYLDGFVGRVYALPLAGCTKPAPVPGNLHATVQVAPPQLARMEGVMTVAATPRSIYVDCYVFRSILTSSTADLTSILSNTRERCTSTVRTLMSS